MLHAGSRLLRNHIGRLVTFIFAGAVLAGALPAMGAPADPFELIENGGFEKADAKGLPVAWRIDWRGFQGVTAKLVGGGGARSGKKALYVQCIASPVDVWLYNRPLDVKGAAGKEVVVSCFYRMTDEPAVDIGLITYGHPFADKEWATPYLTSERNRLQESAEWQLFSWRVRIPAQAQNAILLIRPGSAGELFVDDVSVRPADAPIGMKVLEAGDLVSLPRTREVRLQVRNDTGVERVLRLGMVAGEGKGSVRRFLPLKVPAKGQLPVVVPYPYASDQAHRIGLALEDPTTQQTLDTWIGQALPLLTGRPTEPAFRGTVLGSMPSTDIVVEGRLNAVESLCRQLTLVADLGGAGVIARDGEGIGRPDGPGSWRLSISPKGLLRGRYPLVITVSCNGHKVGSREIQIARAPDAPHEAGYDSRGRFYVDGKSVFVNGLYNVTDDSDLPMAKEQGFNLIVAPTGTVSADFVRRAEKLGMMVSLYSEQMPSPSAVAPSTFWAHAADKYGSSPVMVAWHLVSRPDAILMPPALFAEQQAAMPTIDMHHPTITLLSVPSLLPAFAPNCDILAFESQPVPALPVEAVVDDLGEAQRAAVPGRPVWAAIQSVGRAWLNVGGGLEEEEGGRPPTGAEHRAMTFLTLVHGARGLLHHGLHFRGGHGRSSYYLPDTAPDLWQAMKHTNNLVARLAPAIANGDYRGCEVSGPVHVGAWDCDGRVYVAAVNARPEPSLVTFKVPGKVPDALYSLADSAEITRTANGQFADDLPAYGVRIYVSNSAALAGPG